MEVQVGAAKVAKYGVPESGDTLEIIERPRGGLSAVLVDGQRSGRAAKLISNIVARKALSLLGEGVRDGAAARAAHDYLCTHRSSQVSAELQIVSVDLGTRTLVISRNTQCPALVAREQGVQVLDAPSEPIGIHANTKPVIVELPLEPVTYVVAFTDGVRLAGSRVKAALDLPALVAQAFQERIGAQALADTLLARALELDQLRPNDDLSVLVFAILDTTIAHGVRRLAISFPI